MKMSKFEVSVITNGITYNENGKTSGTAFEEFLKQKPSVQALGEFYYELLRDATRSLILNTANLHGIDYLYNIHTQLEDACIRYARLYYHAGNQEGDRAMVILRGVVQDLVSGYHSNKKYDTVDIIFKGMEALIKV
jgi:hypothetical protein